MVQTCCRTRKYLCPVQFGSDACGYESWVGDGYCDDGAYGMYFDCDEFDCDGGDCDCGDGDGGDGGDDCVNDDSTSDSYGDTCTSWYDAYESPGSSGCTGAYDDDDFNAAEQCCACQEGAFNNGHDDGIANNALSTNDNVNAKVFSNEIATYKKSLRAIDKPVLATATTMINVLTGEITYSDDYSNDNRDVSYTIAVSCDTCLGGGPWSGAWEVAQSDFLVYGFDADSNVCGNVTGHSTELGDTDTSEDACDNAGSGEACEFFDCSGACAEGYESWVGDGYCDDGTYGMFFNCDDFDCDAGDCSVVCWDGSTACTGSTECPDEPACTAASNAVLVIPSSSVPFCDCGFLNTAFAGAPPA